jgi:hypothetical protein
LGNAQALDANGNAYSATINFTGTDNASLIDQYFSGSVFGNGSGSPTADGSQYAWNILHQGDLFNAVAATYNTPNGVFNPGQDSMLAPNPGMQMAGLSAYSQPQGFWGFYAQHEQGIQTGVAVTAGLAATVASFGILAPEAGAGIAAVIAAQAATGAAGGFTTGYLESGFNGGSFTQNLEAGTINGGIGAVFGGGLSAAGVFAPYAGRALTLGYSSLYGGLTDAASVAGQYAGAFIRGYLGAPVGVYTPSELGALQEFWDRLAYARQLTSLAAGLKWLEDGGVIFQGKTVSVVEDLTHVTKGDLARIMETGASPKTVEGEVIQLHHVGQIAEGDLWELPGSLNDVNNLEFHPFGNTPGMGLSPEERSSFAIWRVAYWQARAANELLARWPS